MSFRFFRRAAAVSAVLLGLSGCSSGPCADEAAVADALNEKLLGCESLIRQGLKSYVLPEAVAACEPYADRHCTASDVEAFASYRSCVEDLPECAGNGEAFDAAVEACGAKVTNVSKNCTAAVGALF